MEESFSIDPLTGVITTAKSLDREQQEYYTMTGIVLRYEPVPHNHSHSIKFTS